MSKGKCQWAIFRTVTKTELNCILSLCPYYFVLSLVTFLNLALIYARFPVIALFIHM